MIYAAADTETSPGGKADDGAAGLTSQTDRLNIAKAAAGGLPALALAGLPDLPRRS